MLTLEIGDRPGLEIDEVLAGLAAVVAGFGALDAGVRAYRINFGRQVRPKIGASALPDESSNTFAPLARLAARERELADHVSTLPDAVAADTWRRAEAAARALRAHAARIRTIEKAGRAAADPARRGELDLLTSRLREGVSAYERLTHTAAELVGPDGDADASADAAERLADATDALVGMMRGLAQ